MLDMRHLSNSRDESCSWQKASRKLELSLFELPIPLNKRIGRTIMRQLRFLSTLKLRNDAVRQHFARLDAPLVERIDVPDRALDEDFVFVERDELPLISHPAQDRFCACSSAHRN